MTEVRFYHLETQTLEEALPRLLEEAQSGNVRVVVQAPSPELIDALDARLWTYSDDSFLPHGLARGEAPETQPIVLADDDSNPNGARWRVLVGGAPVLPSLKKASDSPFERIILLFDGADDEARAAARAQWSELKAAGYALSYWRQDDSGHWRQGR